MFARIRNYLVQDTKVKKYTYYSNILTNCCRKFSHSMFFMSFSDNSLLNTELLQIPIIVLHIQMNYVKR